MAGTLGTTIIIGAALAGGFRSTIASAVGGIQQMNGAAVDLGRSLADAGQAWAAMRVFSSATRQAAELERNLELAGITSDASAAQVEELRQQLRQLSVPEKTNQSVGDLLRGYTALVSAGMDRTKAQESLYALGRTATAANADIEDLSKTAFVLVDTLGIAPGDLSAELDKLAFAGKQGAFELRDMARYFPTLGAAAKNLGLTGSEAVATLGAALQIAKKGAADPSEAANNMKNFLAKVTAPETVKKFKEHGVNLKRVLRDAMAKGENPMEVLLAKIQQITKGDPFKMGQLFGDMQVLDFLKPMLANMAEYQRLKKEIATSKGTVDEDFARMLELATEKGKAFSNAVDKLAQSVGRHLLPVLGAVLDVATPMVTWLADAADASPNTTLAVTGVAGAFLVLAPAIRLVGTAWRLMAGAMTANPIGLAITGVVLAAGLIIDNWEDVKGFLTDVWNDPTGTARTFGSWIGGHLALAASQVSTAWQPVKGFLGTLWDEAGQHAQDFLPYLGPVGMVAAAVIADWDKVKGFFVTLWTDPSAAVTQFRAVLSDRVEAGAALVRQAWEPVGAWLALLWNDSKKAAEEFAAFATGIWDKVLKLWDEGVAKVLAMWEKVSSPFDTVIGWFSGDDKGAPKDGEGKPAPAAPATAPRPERKPAPPQPPAPGAGLDAAQARGKDAMRPPAADASGTAPTAPKGGAAGAQPAAAPDVAAIATTMAQTMATAFTAAVQAVATNTAGKVEVVVDFRNVPMGTATSASSSAEPVRVTANRGAAMAGAN